MATPNTIGRYTAAPTVSADAIEAQNEVRLGKGAAGGIKFGDYTEGSETDKIAAAAYGYKTTIIAPVARSTGPTVPPFSEYRGGVYQYRFSKTAQQELFFHCPIFRDYAPGTDLWLYVHWSQIIVDTGGAGGIPGDVKWYFDTCYAKGHDQAAFPAPKTRSVVQTASGTQYQHMAAGVQISADSPAASQYDNADIEPDGMLLIKCYRDPGDAADTLDQYPFFHGIGLHYRSTGIPTPNDAPDFYA